MKYTSGGITANLGEAVTVEVPIPAKTGGGDQQGIAGNQKQDAQPAGPVAKEQGDE